MLKYLAKKAPGFARAVISAEVAAIFYFGTSKTVAQLIAINASFTTSAGTLLGFVITAAAILLALPDRPLVQNIRKTGHLHHLLRQLVATGATLLVLLCVTLMAGFVQDETLGLLSALSVFVAVWAVLLVISVGRKFYLVAATVSRS